MRESFNCQKMLQRLCAAFAAAFFIVAPQHTSAEEAAADDKEAAAVFEMLRGGGYVLVMRHARSPHDQIGAVGLTEGCVLGEGRGLDPTGFFQSRVLGELLAKEEIPILKAYTSHMCRSWDTARLAAGGAPVVSHPSQVSTDPAVIAAFKKEIEDELAANPGTNIILSNHSNIAPLYGAIEEDGEEELPEGMISVVSAPGWNGLSGAVVRITPHIEVTAKSVSVE